MGVNLYNWFISVRIGSDGGLLQACELDSLGQGVVLDCCEVWTGIIRTGCSVGLLWDC